MHGGCLADADVPTAFAAACSPRECYSSCGDVASIQVGRFWTSHCSGEIYDVTP